MQITSKTVLVTGGANGIGKAIASMFLRQNCYVIITDKDIASGKEFEKQNPNAQFISANLCVIKDVESLFTTVASQNKTIDILINNAGISVFKPMIDMTIDEWDQIINTNLRSAFICSRLFALQHPKSTYGRIINIASTRHLMSEPNAEAYAASKGGLVSLTHAMAMSLQDINMTVNCISPGWIHAHDASALTELDHTQHPSKRVGKPDDVANMCRFLCEDENNFITGQNFYIDGGMTKKMIYTD
jgi:NAD(P)-dependent dehydrogenase (short-subunit alcohol dehydrogenase family)